MKLQRSSYGLKDGARLWFELVSTKFIYVGLEELSSNVFLFYGRSAVVLCYGGDLLLLGKSKDVIERFEMQALSRDDRRDLEVPISNSGIEIE